MTDAASATETPSKVRAPIGLPWFSLLLISLLAIVYVYEIGLNTGTGTTPTVETLVMLGGISRSNVLAGDWWRIFTAPLLHANPSHIIGNGLALLIIGSRLEALIGARWFGGIFAVAAMCGSLVSLTVNQADLVAVGASGGIVGLFSIALFASRRVADRRAQTRLIISAGYALAPALLPFLSVGSHSAGAVDYGGHVGGALGGAAMGLLMLRLWPLDARRPSYGWPMALLALAFFASAAFAIIPIRESIAEHALLVPNFPSGEIERFQAANLASQYPHDPRARYAYAWALLAVRDEHGAEVELTAALSEQEILRRYFSTLFADTIRATLALLLVDELKSDEARSVLGSACSDKDLSEKLAAALHKYNLCA